MDGPYILCNPLQFSIVAQDVATIDATNPSLVTAHFVGHVTSTPGTVNHEFTLNTGAWNAKVVTSFFLHNLTPLSQYSFHLKDGVNV